MHAERTPNPNSIKWVLDRAIVEAGVSAHFDVRPSEAVSPLAAKLLGIEARLREAIPEVQEVVAF